MLMWVARMLRQLVQHSMWTNPFIQGGSVRTLEFLVAGVSSRTSHIIDGNVGFISPFLISMPWQS